MTLISTSGWFCCCLNWQDLNHLQIENSSTFLQRKKNPSLSDAGKSNFIFFIVIFWIPNKLSVCSPFPPICLLSNCATGKHCIFSYLVTQLYYHWKNNFCNSGVCCHENRQLLQTKRADNLRPHWKTPFLKGCPVKYSYDMLSPVRLTHLTTSSLCSWEASLKVL